MTKTFKLGAIFFISVLWLVLARILMSYLPLSDNIGSWFAGFLIHIIGMGVIPLVLHKLWIKGGDVKLDFHLKVKINPVNYVIAILLGFLMYYLTLGISMIYQNVLILLGGFTHITTAPGTIYSGIEVLILEFLTVAILPAFFEEFMDRGLLMSVFSEEKDERKVILIMALLFALGHQNIVQTGYTFFGGIVLSFMAVKTKSIFPSVIIHLINNGISVVSEYSSQKGGNIGALRDWFFDYYSGHVGTIMLSWLISAAIIILLLYIVHKLNHKKQIPLMEAHQPEEMRIETIYGMFGEQNYEKRLPEPVKPKIGVWDYGLIIAAGALAFITTVFTYIWGVLR